MTVEFLNPSGLVDPQAYSQVGVATGSRMVFVAGQVSQDSAGSVVGPGDLATQVAQVLLNVSIALEAAGATFADVVKTTIYVVGWRPEFMAALMEGHARAAAQIALGKLAPTTLIGVQSLTDPDLLVEMEVVAVL
jgi:enamine deaminase RidA (YjgF/YER057c/UK114 family)